MMIPRQLKQCPEDGEPKTTKQDRTHDTGKDQDRQNLYDLIDSATGCFDTKHPGH